ncbi:MAG: VrrA/YqfQ family protein [Coprobacillus sp.]
MYPNYPNIPNYPYPNFPQQMPFMPYMKPSLLQSMKLSLGQMNMSSTIRTVQKTLYTANQIIPIVNQLRPVLHNATTAFRVVKAVKQFDFDDIDQDIEQNVQPVENAEELQTTKTSTPQTFENML